MRSSIQIRRAREEDVLPAMVMVMKTLNHLRKKHQMKPIKFNLSELPPVQKHTYETDPKTTFCAWRGKKIVGFTQALNRRNQWYLAYLFIDPSVQDKGVGRKLLEKVWRDGINVSHALCTFSYNMQAVGIYSQFGMAPLMTLAWMGGTPGKFTIPKPTNLAVSGKLSAEDIRWINTLEAKIRGYGHPEEWSFWTTNEHFAPYIFRDKGKRVGYGLIYKKMGIGPIGAIDNQYTVKIAAELIRRTDPPKKEDISIWTPTHNLALYQFLIKSGFRLGELAVFMADAPYADFQRYLPTHLAIF